MRSRILFEFFQQVLDGLFELRIAALTPGGRIEFDFDIGSDTGVLDLPFAVEAIDCRVGRGHPAAVHQLRDAKGGNQSSPCALPDERPDLRLAKEPGNGVATS